VFIGNSPFELNDCARRQILLHAKLRVKPCFGVVKKAMASD
jgi:hypothetical protein